MKRYLLLTAGLSMWLSFAGAVLAQAASGDAESEVRAAMEKYRVALTNRDATALKKIWADDYTFINGAGQVVTKEQRLANLDSGATSLAAINTSDDKTVRVYGDVAVAVSQVTINGQYSGKEASGAYQSMLVWVKRGNDWQLIANQITPITSKK